MGAVWSEPGPADLGSSAAQAPDRVRAGHFFINPDLRRQQGRCAGSIFAAVLASASRRSASAEEDAEGSALMRRFLSFRDFDWALLGLVLLLCSISVLEIYSATLHTKVCQLRDQADYLDRRRAGGHVRLCPRSTITA